MSFKEMDTVALVEDLPGPRLRAGDVGTIVEILGHGESFEVEFVSGGGTTLAVLALRAGQLRLLDRKDVLTARPLDAA